MENKTFTNMANYKCIRSFKSSNITTNRDYYYGNTIGHSEYQRLAYYEQANFQKVYDEDTTTGYSGLSSTSSDLDISSSSSSLWDSSSNDSSSDNSSSSDFGDFGGGDTGGGGASGDW